MEVLLYLSTMLNKSINNMTLEELIKDAEWNIQYHQKRLKEEQTKLDAYYIARDAKADNPHAK